jgi:voltage-gated potassium channel
MTKKRVWEVLHATQREDRFGCVVTIFLLSLIAANVIGIILESVDSIAISAGGVFGGFELFSVAVFTIEYVLRVYSCTADPRFSRPIVGRLHYAATPMALVDLLAILPFYLSLEQADLRFVRAFRLLRVFRLGKIGRYSRASRLLGDVIRERKEELILVASGMIVLIVTSASAMYFVENGAQPDRFPHIPAAMWWAVTTLTTVGYGDIYPVTTFGKLLASLIQIAGIAFFALPSGIVGASLLQQFERRRKPTTCPHCGKEMHFQR